jgi:hypothetical protein
MTSLLVAICSNKSTTSNVFYKKYASLPIKKNKSSANNNNKKPKTFLVVQSNSATQL